MCEILTEQQIQSCLFPQYPQSSLAYLLGSCRAQKSAFRQLLRKQASFRTPAPPIRLPAHDFANQFITAISEGLVSECRSSFCRCSVLMIQQIEFIGGKIQFSEFLHEILEYRRRRALPTILGGSCLPQDIPYLDPRNRTQLESAALVKLPDTVDPIPPEQMLGLYHTVEKPVCPEASTPFFAAIQLQHPDQSLPMEGRFSRHKTKVCFLPDGHSEEDAPFIVDTDPRYSALFCWLSEYEIPVQLEGALTRNYFYLSSLSLFGKETEDRFELAEPEEKPPIIPVLETVSPSDYTYFRDEAAALATLTETPVDMERLLRYLEHTDSYQAYHRLFQLFGSQLPPDVKAQLRARVRALYGRYR